MRSPNSYFARRAFLSRIGLAAAASPFVPLLNASGQEAGRPKRLLLLFTPHGTVYQRWKPTGSETDFQLNTINAPLERFKKKINVLAGINMPNKGPGVNHNKGVSLLFTGSQLATDMTFMRPPSIGGGYYGWSTGTSLDQFLVQRLQPKTLYASLEFGVRTGSARPDSRIIYSGPARPLAPENNPYAAFDRLFTNKGGDELRAERRSAIDVLLPELEGLRLKVSASERPKIEAHLQAVRAIEKRLATTGALCKGASAPPGLQGAQVNWNDNANTPWSLDRQLELIALAFTCDITRFASLQYSIGDNDSRPYPWLGINENHHDPLSHAGDGDTAARDKLTKIYTWFHERVAYLLEKLDAIPEGSGTVLDNTLVIWGSEIGTGNSHSQENVPFITAGGAGGALRTGRFLDLPRGTAHNRLLVTACHAFGLADVNTFGNNDNGSGPLRALIS